MMHPALIASLAPLSAIQGLWLRRVATRLPGASGERSGQVGDGDSLHLLALGDSIIDGVGVSHTQHSLPVHYARHWAKQAERSVQWRLEGRSGWDIDDVIHHLLRLDDIETPDRVLISVGVNDVTGLTRRPRWRRQLEQLLLTCHSRWPNATLIFCGLPPMCQFPLLPQPLRDTLAWRSEALDRIAAEVVAGFPWASHYPTDLNPADHDFCEDGFHPSAESCNLWARKLVSMQNGGSRA